MTMTTKTDFSIDAAGEGRVEDTDGEPNYG